MAIQVTRATGSRTAGPGRKLLGTGLRVVTVAGLALLAACQTGAGDADAGSAPPAASSSAAAEPSESVTTEPTAEPTAEPTEEPTDGGGTGQVVNGPNSITAPTPDETVSGPSVTVTGTGTAFEATLSYQVLVAGTEDVVTQGFTNAGANGEVGPYSFTVELEPGSYTVQVWEADMSDGENELGPYLNLVEVDITVE